MSKVVNLLGIMLRNEILEVPHAEGAFVMSLLVQRCEVVESKTENSSIVITIERVGTLRQMGIIDMAKNDERHSFPRLRGQTSDWITCIPTVRLYNVRS